MLGYALYAQYGLGLEPCPLCIFQRITIITLGCLFLAVGLQHPRGNGRYVYADYCGGQIHSLDLSSKPSDDRNEGLNPLPNPAPNPVSFGEDSCGRLYVMSGNGKVFQIVGE